MSIENNTSDSMINTIPQRVLSEIREFDLKGVYRKLYFSVQEHEAIILPKVI